MTKPVRYQKGHLYQNHGAWFVRYRECVKDDDGAITRRKKTHRLASLHDYPTESEIEPLRADLMLRVNSGKVTSSCVTLAEFVEKVYLPFIREEKRASTYKSYLEIWKRHVRDRVGGVRLNEFRTMHASRMLKDIASEHDLTRTTLQHVKSMLSGVFTYAKNEGALDGINPVVGALIPSRARKPSETHAYSLAEILQILDVLPLLPKAVVATAALAGLREGELKALDWTDFTGTELRVTRSIWRGVVNPPKTRASAAPVPVIPELADILGHHRASLGNPPTGVMFHSGNGEPVDMDKLAQRVVRPAVEATGLRWFGWHGFRRGIASNLYQLGADEKVVQRVLRHAKAHVTKERYIKVFEPAVNEAMDRMQAALQSLKRKQSPATAQQIN